MANGAQLAFVLWLREPPAPPAEARRVQNEVGMGIAEAAFVYKITGEKKYLDAAKKYMDAAVSYDVWGYSYNKPNVDLAAGHLLYGMGWAYDLLYHDLTVSERGFEINWSNKLGYCMNSSNRNPARAMPIVKITPLFRSPV